MRFILMVLSIGLAHSASAQARISKYEVLTSKIKTLNPLSDADVGRASPTIVEADAEIEKFDKLKVKRSDEFATLVILTGYGMPLGLAAESVETIGGLAQRPELKSAFDAAVKSLDYCRRQYLLDEVNNPVEIGVDTKTPAKSMKTAPVEFNYKSCVATHPKIPKH